MRTVDLRAEAIAEAARLTAARAMLRDGDQRALMDLESDAAWIAFTRRPAQRRVSLVWRITLEDQSGRIVESRLVPVIVEVAGIPGKAERRQWIRQLLRQVDADVRARVDEAADQWRESADHVTDAFTSARLRREEAIVERSSRTAGAASQPGLFDRRAERSRLTQATAIAASEQADVVRMRTIAALTAITRQPARLLLVLVD